MGSRFTAFFSELVGCWSIIMTYPIASNRCLGVLHLGSGMASDPHDKNEPFEHYRSD